MLPSWWAKCKLAAKCMLCTLKQACRIGFSIHYLSRWRYIRKLPADDITCTPSILEIITSLHTYVNVVTILPQYKLLTTPLSGTKCYFCTKCKISTSLDVLKKYKRFTEGWISYLKRNSQMWIPHYSVEQSRPLPLLNCAKFTQQCKCSRTSHTKLSGSAD